MRNPDYEPINLNNKKSVENVDQENDSDENSPFYTLINDDPESDIQYD